MRFRLATFNLNSFVIFRLMGVFPIVWKKVANKWALEVKYVFLSLLMNTLVCVEFFKTISHLVYLLVLDSSLEAVSAIMGTLTFYFGAVILQLHSMVFIKAMFPLLKYLLQYGDATAKISLTNLICSIVYAANIVLVIGFTGVYIFRYNASESILASTLVSLTTTIFISNLLIQYFLMPLFLYNTMTFVEILLHGRIEDTQRHFLTQALPQRLATDRSVIWGCNKDDLADCRTWLRNWSPKDYRANLLETRRSVIKLAKFLKALVFFFGLRILVAVMLVQLHIMLNVLTFVGFGPDQHLDPTAFSYPILFVMMVFYIFNSQEGYNRVVSSIKTL